MSGGNLWSAPGPHQPQIQRGMNEHETDFQFRVPPGATAKSHLTRFVQEAGADHRKFAASRPQRQATVPDVRDTYSDRKPATVRIEPVFVYQMQNLNGLLHHRLKAATSGRLPRHYSIIYTHLWHCIGLLKEIQNLHNQYIQLDNRDIYDYIVVNLQHLEHVVSAAREQDLGTHALVQQAQQLMPLVEKLSDKFDEYERVYNPDPKAAYGWYQWRKQFPLSQLQTARNQFQEQGPRQPPQ